MANSCLVTLVGAPDLHRCGQATKKLTLSLHIGTIPRYQLNYM